jgi:hypothetical protein
VTTLLERVEILEKEVKELKRLVQPVSKDKGFVLTCRHCMGKHTVYYLSDKKDLPEGWTRCPHCGVDN